MSAFLLQHLLVDAVERDPQKEAVICPDRSISYEQLESKSSRLANAMIRMGVEKGDRVGLLFDKSIESITALYSVLKTGAAYVPIDPLSPKKRAGYILEHCGIKTLLTSAEKAKKLPSERFAGSSVRRILVSGEPSKNLVHALENMEVRFWEEIFRAEDDRLPDCGISDNSPAYILYTSGSTGSPKGVVISHLNAMTFVKMAKSFFQIDKSDRLCNHAPLHFDLSVFDIFASARAGAAVVLVPEFLSVFPYELAKYIDTKRITIWNSVASVLSLLAERGKLEIFDFDALRLVIFSGELLPVKALRKVRSHMPRAQFFNVYGQTEANSSTCYRIEQIPAGDAWRTPIGKPFPNFELFALDETGKVVRDPGIEGELYVRGSTVAMGYWGDREKTDASFVPDPLRPSFPRKVYRTGDIVRLDGEGNYVFVARRDNLVKSRGYRIEIDEILISIYSCPGIKQAAVVAVPDERIGNRIIAYVSPENGAELSEKKILAHCAKQIPKYMIPESVEIRRMLPVTSTGKVDRKSLEKEAMAREAGNAGK